MKLRSGKVVTSTQPVHQSAKETSQTLESNTQPTQLSQHQQQQQKQHYCEACAAGQLSQWAHTCVFVEPDFTTNPLPDTQDY